MPTATKRAPDAAAADQPPAKRLKEEKSEKKLLPVTVLSGFLGAGKTTLLKHILKSNNAKDAKKIAVIVNDMGEVNLDAEDIKHSKLIQEEAEMVELHNGCICCTLRGDLLKTVKALSEEAKFDYLVIESTGISEPLPVAQTFVMDVDGNGHDHAHDHDHDHDHEESGESTVATPGQGGEVNSKGHKVITTIDALSNYAKLDTCVTVVDSLNIFDVLGSIETLADENNMSGMKGNEPDPSQKPEGKLVVDNKDAAELKDDDEEEEEGKDERSIAQLMLDQLEFANVVVLSKIPMLLEQAKEECGLSRTGKGVVKTGVQRLNEIKALVKKLNPSARIVACEEDKFKDLDVEEHLLNTGLFNMEVAQQSAGWIQEINNSQQFGGAGHTPETEEYGVSSIVFKTTKMPFHPTRLKEILAGFGNYAGAVNAASGTQSDEVFKGVVRAKGQLWLANANAFPINFHTAGKHVELVPNEESWIAALDPEEWEDEDKEHHEELKKNGKWSEKYGDRFSELVFIGVNMDKAKARQKLEEALLTEEESKALGGMDGWRKLEDAFFGGACAEEYFEVVYYDEEDGPPARMTLGKNTKE